MQVNVPVCVRNDLCACVRHVCVCVRVVYAYICMCGGKGEGDVCLNR